MPTLKDISTKELIGALRSHRIFTHDGADGWYDNSGVITGFQKRGAIANRLVKGGDSVCVSASEDELLAELNTRPHIPGRNEGKLLRRLMSQTGWTADQLRAHPKFGEMLADNQHPKRQHISKKHAAHFQKAYGRGFGNKFKVVKS